MSNNTGSPASSLHQESTHAPVVRVSPTPEQILKHAEVPGYPGLYTLGFQEQYVNFYSQQVRAFNLALALEQELRLVGVDQNSPCRVAVIGGGVGGSMLALALAMCHCTVTLFERRTGVPTLPGVKSTDADSASPTDSDKATNANGMKAGDTKAEAPGNKTELLPAAKVGGGEIPLNGDGPPDVAAEASTDQKTSNKTLPGNKKEFRTIHPHLMHWPYVTGRGNRAGLPYMDWEAGPLNIVKATLKKGVAKWQKRIKTEGKNPVTLRTGANVVQVKRELPTDALRPRFEVEFFAADATSQKLNDNNGKKKDVKKVKQTATFDIVVLASGFGDEKYLEQFGCLSYWDPELLGQMANAKGTALVSGVGDGGLEDVIQLALKRTTPIYQLLEGTILNPTDETLREQVEELEQKLVEVERQAYALEESVQSRFLEEQWERLISKDSELFRRTGSQIRGYVKLTSENVLHIILNASSTSFNTLQASVIHRLVVFFLCKIAAEGGVGYKIEFVSGKFDYHQCEKKTDKKWRCVLTGKREETTYDVDLLILRHGPEKAIERIKFSPSEIKEKVEELRHRNALDQTRFPIWPMYGNPKRYLPFHPYSDGDREVYAQSSHAENRTDGTSVITADGSPDPKDEKRFQLKISRLGVRTQSSASYYVEKPSEISTAPKEESLVSEDAPSLRTLNELVLTLKVETHNPPDGSLAAALKQKFLLELVYVPGGVYSIGLPEHRKDVKLTGFWISRYPIPYELYCAVVPFCGADWPLRFRHRATAEWEDFVKSYGNHPVNGISWKDAVLFCQALGMSMPTAAQWEVAAIGFQKRHVDLIQDPHTDYVHFRNQGRMNGTAVVDAYAYARSPLGLVQPLGNVWEFCLDSWASDGARWFAMQQRQYQDQKDQLRAGVFEFKNPIIYNSSREREMRGHSWLDLVRPSYHTRGHNFALNRNDRDGFRVVWTGEMPKDQQDLVDKFEKAYSNAVPHAVSTSMPTETKCEPVQLSDILLRRLRQVEVRRKNDEKGVTHYLSLTELKARLKAAPKIWIILGRKNKELSTDREMAALSCDAWRLSELTLQLATNRRAKAVPIHTRLDFEVGLLKTPPAPPPGETLEASADKKNGDTSPPKEEAGNADVIITIGSGSVNQWSAYSADKTVPGFESATSSMPFGREQFFDNPDEAKGCGMLVAHEVDGQTRVLIAGRNGYTTAAGIELFRRVLGGNSIPSGGFNVPEACVVEIRRAKQIRILYRAESASSTNDNQDARTEWQDPGVPKGDLVLLSNDGK